MHKNRDIKKMNNCLEKRSTLNKFNILRFFLFLFTTAFSVTTFSSAVLAWQLPAASFVKAPKAVVQSKTSVVELSPAAEELSAADIDIINKIRMKEMQSASDSAATVQTGSTGGLTPVPESAYTMNSAVSALTPASGALAKGTPLPIPGQAVGGEQKKTTARKPYKPLQITGEKVFILDDVSVKGNFSRYATENFDSYPGFRYSSELRLNLEGNIAENVRVSASLDDTNMSQETKRVTLFVDGRVWNFTLGDFTTSYTDTEFTLFNKKLKGVEAIGNLHDGKYQVKAIASRSEGKSKTDVFTGSGMQSEYQLTQRPIVQNSEVVKLDGRTLKRGTDYTIDYEDGSIILKAQILPLESRNRINVEYEYFENGKMFRRTLVGIREITEFKNLNRLGFTVLREEDDKGSVAGATSAEVQVKPSATTVYGFDFKLDPKISSLKLDGEMALSVVDPNLLSKETKADQNINGFARFFRASLAEKKYSFTARNQQMGKDFVSVGKNRLEIDESRNDVTLKLTPVEKVSFQFDVEDATRATMNDPDLPSSTNTYVDVNSKAFRSFSTIKAGKTLSLGVNTYEKLKRNDLSRLDFHEQSRQAEIVNDHKKFIERARYNIRTIDSKYDLTRKQDEKTYNLGFVAAAWEKLNFSLEYSNIKTEMGQDQSPVSSIDNFSLDATSNITKKLSLNSVFLVRNESNLQTARKDNLITTDSKLRFNPSDVLQMQARYKEMHSKKFLLDKTNNEKILELQSGIISDTNYIKVEEPVTTQTGSFLVDISPFQMLRTQLQYQFKNLININTRARMSVSDSALAEFKLAPNNTVSTIYRLMNSKNTQSVGELMESRNLNHNLEVRKSVNAKLAVISSLELDKKTDSYRPLENADSFGKSLKLEKDVSSALNVSAGLGHYSISRCAPYRDSNKISILSGFRLIPKLFKMTLRGNLDHSIEDDSVARKKKTVLETLLDYDLGGETEISANYKFINSGKTELEEAYRSRAGKVTLTKRF